MREFFEAVFEDFVTYQKLAEARKRMAALGS